MSDDNAKSDGRAPVEALARGIAAALGEDFPDPAKRERAQIKALADQLVKREPEEVAEMLRLADAAWFKRLVAAEVQRVVDEVAAGVAAKRGKASKTL